MNYLTLEKINAILNARKYLSELDEKRFWDKVDIKDLNSCWIWTSTLSKQGYGKFYLRKRTKYAHRISFIISGCMVDRNNYVLHKCDNPKCVNPNHLFEGTQMDNIQDMHQKKRNNPITKLNSTQIKFIKWMLKYRPERGLAKNLALLYNISPVTISQIKLGKSRAEIKL